ncbi:MAG: hypothetical protein ACHQFW_03550 [Chitinophagales bacterium]
MNKLGLFILLTFIFFSCGEKKTPAVITGNTQEEKAQSSATIYMEEKAGKNYESQGFGAFDTIKTQPNLDSLKVFQEKADYYLSKAEELISRDFKRSGMYSDSSIVESKKTTSYLQNFKPVILGYAIQHFYNDGDKVATKKEILLKMDTAFRVTEALYR